MAIEEECFCPEVEERVEWIYTYGDMVTLILCFFIILFANSKTKEEDFKAISAALRGGPPASPYFFEGSPSVIELLQQKIEESSVSDEFNVTVDDRGISVVLNENIVFNPGSAVLNENAREVLSRFSELIYSIPNSITIEGHTDNLPIARSFQSNWHLSAARASSVAQALQEEGISKQRLEAIGYGDSRPLTSNDTPEGRRLNRRVNILIKPVEAYIDNN